MKLKYGLHLPNFGPFGYARQVADVAAVAESAGWNGLFIWDHVTRVPAAGAVVDPWIALTAAAMTTEHLQLGTMITPLPRRRPWMVARQAASLDQLSNGRFILGVGIGSGRAVEWDHFDEELDPHKRAQMLDEALDILVGLWTGEPFSYQGKHYTVKESQFIPPPARRIPIWVAGIWPNKAPFRRAARWDGVYPLRASQVPPTDDEYRMMLAYIDQHRNDDEPFDVAYIGSSFNNAVRVAPGTTWWFEDINPERFGASWDAEWPLETMIDHIQRGPPAIPDEYAG